MSEVLFYSLESAVCVGVFTLFYLLILRKETFFALNRFYLLFAMIFSLIVPFLNITYGDGAAGATESGIILNNTLSSINSIKHGVVQLDPVVITASKASWNISLGQIILGSYLIGLVFFFSIFGLRFFHLFRTIKSSSKSYDGKYCYLKIAEQPEQVYSFFHYIFIGKEKLKHQEYKPIIEHEKSHANLFHSLDLLLVEVLIVLQWFNPFIYLLRKMVVENHEFQADSSVIRSCGNRESYLRLILNHVINSHYFRMTSSFSHSLSKKRLKMLTRIKSSYPVLKAKVLAVVPIAAALFFIFACSEETPESAKNDAKKEPIAFQQVQLNKSMGEVPQSLINQYRNEIKEKGEHILMEFFAEFDENEYPQNTLILKNNVTYGFYLYNYGKGKSYAYLEVADTTGKVASSTKGKWMHGTDKQQFYFDNQIPTQPFVISVKDSKNRANKVVVVVTATTSLGAESNKGSNVYLNPDEMPLYKDNQKLNEFRTDLMENLDYPEKAKEQNIDGIVYVEFIVNEEGKIEDKTIVRGAHPLLNQATLDAFEGLPDWKPGIVEGKPVKTKFTIPVVFRLD
jgi:TonB family protein